jgi:hypothetical protein
MRIDEIGDGGLRFESGTRMEVLRPDIGTQPWLSWPGKWGDSDSSPQGPMWQPDGKWQDPAAWAFGLTSTCE